MNVIKIKINKQSGLIEVMNNGCYIDLVKHDVEEEFLIPELIFT